MMSDSFHHAAAQHPRRVLIYALLIVLFTLPCAVTAADNGFIAVQSTPDGARIFVDGAYQGTAPWKGIFPAGEHTLKCTYAGYQDYETTFILHPLESKNFEVVLIPLPVTGTISVASTPSEARVFIDDVMVGLTPFTGTFPAGVHTLRIIKTDYEDFGTTVTVDAGKTTAVTANLVAIPQTGTVTVFSTPAGASVFFDGVSYGPAPVTATLAPGIHTLTVSRSGYNDYVASVSVTAGETVPVYVTLVPGTVKATITPAGTVTATQSVTSTITQAATASPGGVAGSLLLTSRPGGANVYVDGTYIGRAPAGMRSVPAGPHAVLFTMSGYEDFATTVQVTSGETAEFTATLDPVPQRGTPVADTTKAPGAGVALALLATAGYAALRKRD